MKKILTTHVGSLPREQEVVDFIFARERKEVFVQSEFDECMRKNVLNTVKKQFESGIDIVSDGETSKISYATYVKDRYLGFSGESERKPPQDLKLFPRFLERMAKDGGTPSYARPKCTSEVGERGNDDLEKDIDNLNFSVQQVGATSAFMNAASPGVISLFLQNNFYPSREKYLVALADVMKNEYRAIIDSGLILQLDCPDLALSRHMLFSDLSDAEFVKIADHHIQILNYALAGLPTEKIRVHVCWGNYEGPHICDIGMAKLFNILMRVHAGYILFETSNPRHAHEWTVFKEKRRYIPDNMVLIPGVIDSTTNFVEHPELIAQRLGRFIDIVGFERVIAGSDCGFGTFAGFGTVDPDIAFAKLFALREGADIVASRFYPNN